MNRRRKKSKSPLAKLKQIDRLVRRINERRTRLENASHVPRTEPLPKGQIPTIFNDCDESCSTCALGEKYANRFMRLGELQRAALIENVQSRLESDKALAKSRRKITITAYLDATSKARQKKELAILLGVSAEGLRRWEKRNHIKWDKNKGVSYTP